MTDLPIEPVLPELLRALDGARAAVLQAPPGAGKTTRVPLALLAEPWLDGGRIIMLEPRRLAARAAARRMASMIGEQVGRTVGYRMRMETVVGAATRIEVVTEGVLARMLQSDPALDGVAVVIFDEYHERSLHADLGLALALQSRALLRDDLRLLVMSATLDGDPVAALLGGAPIVTSEGRSFAVDVRYVGRALDERIETAVAATIRRAIAESSGDVLAFLPGAAEIRRVEETLRRMELPSVRVAPLHGSLAQEQQDVALAPARRGERKVVLATSIAETSITIDGIGIVVDSGLMRVPRFSPRTGMTRLETVRVTQASAEQRRGRAGRLGPGVCYRLWSEVEQAHLTPQGQPEILEADLTPLALELAVWGTADPSQMQWLDAPPAAAYSHARDLLIELGALSRDGAVTDHGRRMSELPLHPRLAHMVVRGHERGVATLACELAAVLSERDMLRATSGSADVDIRARVDAVRGVRAGQALDHGTLQRVRASARGIHARMLAGLRALGDIEHQRGARRDDDMEDVGLLLAYAYPDRVGAMRHGQSGRFLLRNGRSAIVHDASSVARSEYIVAADLVGAGREARVWIAAPITLEQIEEGFAVQFEEDTVVEWDDAGLRAQRIERLGAITIRETPIADPDADVVARALAGRIRSAGIATLPWSKSSRSLQQRMLFLRSRDSDWPDVSDDALQQSIDQWLLPHLLGKRRQSDIDRLDLHAILLGMLTWQQRQQLDERAPTHIEVPSGSRIPIDYAMTDAPVLAVRLQEMFGALDTPRIDRGSVPLTVHLLSPAGRPAQVTRDLASFWRSTYFDVRKDLKGRYPKHYWPDNPLEAEPTRRARPR